MNKERIIELVKQFHNENYKDLFGALIVFEKGDYYWKEELEELNDGDIEWLEKMYQHYMDNDYYTGLINREFIEYMEDMVD